MTVCAAQYIITTIITTNICAMTHISGTERPASCRRNERGAGEPIQLVRPLRAYRSEHPEPRPSEHEGEGVAAWSPRLIPPHFYATRSALSLTRRRGNTMGAWEASFPSATCPEGQGALQPSKKTTGKRKVRRLADETQKRLVCFERRLANNI